MTAELRVRGFEIHADYMISEKEDLVTIPQRATSMSAGYDIHAAAPGVLKPGQRLLVPTGLTVYMQPHEELQIRSRSGLAIKHGVIVLNEPGTVDADYYGKEIKVILFNTGDTDFEFEVGDRIAQGVFATYLTTDNDQPVSNKRNGGFGHTGR